MYRSESLCFIACVSSSVVQQLTSTESWSYHRSSRQLAIGRSRGSESCSISVDESPLEQAPGGLVEQDVVVVVEPGEKLVHQVPSFLLRSVCEPELGVY